MSIVWFRRWYAFAVLVGFPRKRVFLRSMMTLHGQLCPLWNFIYWVKHPATYIQYRRLYRLHIQGITEVAL